MRKLLITQMLIERAVAVTQAVAQPKHPANREELNKKIICNLYRACGNSDIKCTHLITALNMLGHNLPILKNFSRMLGEGEINSKPPMFFVGRCPNGVVHLILNTGGGFVWIDKNVSYDPDGQGNCQYDPESRGRITLNQLSPLDEGEIRQILNGRVIEDESCQSTTNVLVAAGFFEEIEEEKKIKVSEEEEEDNN